MKTCIVGAFDFKNLPTGGQPVKTRNLYYLLKEKYGEDISFIDTYGWKKHVVHFVSSIKSAIKNNEVIILLLARNGIKLLLPLILFLNKKKKRRIFYDVIGGWLPDLLLKNRRLASKLKTIDGIWVETGSMVDALHLMNFSNVYLVLNFKFIKPIDVDLIESPCIKESIKCCTFSRVTPQKGISDAITIVKKLRNENYNLTLDIYGPIDEPYKVSFFKEISECSDFIEYKGIVFPQDSVQTISRYDALLFPTRFDTEGVPGTIVDSYAAGVPVICAKWKNCSSVFEESLTGYGFKMYDLDDFYLVVKKMLDYQLDWFKMRITSRLAYDKFSPTKVGKMIFNLLEDSCER